MPTAVSVIITSYNYAGFLPGALDSVLAQTYSATEIIVVDDGSTDDTRQVVAMYADRGVRYIYKENGGISSARNVGIRASSGELVAFLDSDDRWMLNKLALQVEHLDRHPEVGLVTASEWQAGAHGESPWLLQRKPATSQMMLREALVENFIGNASLVLIRRSVFDQLGLFDEGVGLGQDWDMWIRIARSYPISVLPEALIVYSRHEGSVSAGKVWQRYRSNRVFHRRYISQLRSPLRRLWVLRAAQSMNLYYAAVSLAGGRGTRISATAMSLVALLIDPFYKSKLKVALLLRTGCGEAVWTRLKAAWPGKHASFRR